MRLLPENLALPEDSLPEDYLLLFAALALPFAFGGVEIWAYRSAAFLIAAAAAVAVLTEGWEGLGVDRRSMWLLPAALLAAWAAFQLLPLPSWAIRVTTPEAYRIYEETFPGYPGGAPEDVTAAVEDQALARVAEAYSPPPVAATDDYPFKPEPSGRWSGWKPISLHPSATSERLFWYLALLLAFLVTTRRTTDSNVAHYYRIALFGLFVALAIVGLIQMAMGSGKLLWIRTLYAGGRPFGPYVNATHFGGMMEMAVPWLVGSAWFGFRATGWQGFRAARVPLYLAAALLCIIAGFATGTKMGATLIVVSVFTLALLGIRQARKRGLVVAVLVVVGVALLVLVFYSPAGKSMQDFAQVSVSEMQGYERVVVWKSCGFMLADFPITGSGFGSFEQVFPRYMPPGEPGRWARAHNDYIQVLVEGGLIAGVLVLVLTVAFWRRALRRIPELGSRSEALPLYGLLLGLASLSVHAFVDFNHQNPANALVFVMVAALAVNGEGGRKVPQP